MKLAIRRLMSATAMAGLIVAIPLTYAAHAADDDANPAGINRGFNPDTGQINPGFDVKNPSSSTARPIPTPEEARAAKMAVVSMQPALGNDGAAPVPRTDNMRPETKDGQATAGGPQATNASDDPMRNGSQPNGGENGPALNGDNQPRAATMGSGSRDGNAANSQTPPTEASSSGSAAAQIASSPGPIGATAQTLPAKLSPRNDILDRVPIMAMPMVLTDQQRQQIYQAVMADKSAAVAGVDNLKPASALPTDMALNDTHPLPEAVQSSPLLKGLHYVKGKNKVLLVEPSTRVVVDQFTS